NQTGAGTCSDQRVIWTSEQQRIADKWGSECCGDAPEQTGHGEAVRNQIVLQVGERHASENREEYGKAERRERRAKIRDGQRPQDADGELAEWVDERDGLVAAAAPRTQRDPAED